MTAQSGDTETSRPPTKDIKPRALADLQLNTILALENGTSSEDEAQDVPVIPVEDIGAVIGVAISHEQTRLTSPKTPAVEKAAAIEEAGGFFGSLNDTLYEEHEGEDNEGTGQHQQRDGVEGTHETEGNAQASAVDVPGTQDESEYNSPVRLPSPWRAEPRVFVNTSKSRAKPAIRDGSAFYRRRASSGPPESTFESWQRAFMANLPSMPRYLSPTPESGNTVQDAAVPRRKRSSFSWSSVGNYDGTGSQTSSRQRSGSGNGNTQTPRPLGQAKVAQAQVGNTPSIPVSPRPGPPQLRRSASDHSLIAHRTLSTASSLGDDTRFEHITEQVNSRMNAIKDSLRDSNIKIPSLPSISSFTNYRPDFLRERAGSMNGGSQPNNADYDKATTKQPTDPITRQPYHSAQEAMSDTSKGRKSSQHPSLNRALEQLEGDVVVLGGYRGSVLRTAEYPHRQVWVPVKVGLNLRKVDLEVGLKEDDDERATEKIIPGGMLSHIGPVDISRRLFKRMRSCENARQRKLRVHDYGYDWRLHPLYLSAQMIKFLEALPCNKPSVPKEKRGATVIAHSLGGLIIRHAINQRPELFRGVVYAGVPHTCVNILGPMRNGDEVLLSSRVLTAQVNFTIRTSFALLPLDGRCFFDTNTKEEYPIDFFDPQTWIDNRLSPCVGRVLPPLAPQPKATGIAGYMSAMANALPSLPIPGRKSSLANSVSRPQMNSSAAVNTTNASDSSDASGTANMGADVMMQGTVDVSDMGRHPDVDVSSSVRTAVTLPRDELIAYLTRTLATVKRFKLELAHNPKHTEANAYPPISLIYGKSTPTVYDARINGREGMKHADAYDALAFASGDGVVLAKAAMVPEGYTTARGGIVSSDRGHVTLLGDLEAVGKCLCAIIAAKKRGVGDGAFSA